MELHELRIGMLLDGHSREYDYADKLRVEFVASDWAVARNSVEDGEPFLLTKWSYLEEYDDVAE